MLKSWNVNYSKILKFAFWFAIPKISAFFLLYFFGSKNFFGILKFRNHAVACSIFPLLPVRCRSGDSVRWSLFAIYGLLTHDDRGSATWVQRARKNCNGENKNILHVLNLRFQKGNKTLPRDLVHNNCFNWSPFSNTDFKMAPYCLKRIRLTFMVYKRL